MQLSYIQPLFWMVPTVPEGYVYHIDFPGPDLLAPAFVVVKGTPADQSGETFQPNTEIEIGTFGTFAAAQAACEADYTGTHARVVLPIPSVTAPQQPTQPVI